MKRLYWQNSKQWKRYDDIALFVSSSFALDKIELTHDMKNSNKSNETNAHDKNNIWRNLETRGVVCVELKHCTSCSTSGTAAATTTRLPPPHTCSCSCTSSLWSSTSNHFCFTFCFSTKVNKNKLRIEISAANVYKTIERSKMKSKSNVKCFIINIF